MFKSIILAKSFSLIGIIIIVLTSCNKEEQCSDPSIQFIGTDSLYWELYEGLTRGTGYRHFNLYDSEKPEVNDTFYLPSSFDSWKERPMQVFDVNDCSQVVLHRYSFDMNVPRKGISHRFYLYYNNEHEEQFPELLVVYNYQGISDSGFFKFDQVYGLKRLVSIDNPSMSLRIQKDSGIVYMGYEGLFEIKKHVE